MKDLNMNLFTPGKRLLCLLILPLIFFGCSKDNDVMPENLRIQSISNDFTGDHTFTYTDSLCTSVSTQVRLLTTYQTSLSWSEGKLDHFERVVNFDSVAWVFFTYNDQGVMETRVYKEHLYDVQSQPVYKTFAVDSFFYENDRLAYTSKYKLLDDDSSFVKFTDMRYIYHDDWIESIQDEGAINEEFYAYTFDDKRTWTDNISLYCAVYNQQFPNPAIHTTHNIISVAFGGLSHTLVYDYNRLDLPVRRDGGYIFPEEEYLYESADQ